MTPIGLEMRLHHEWARWAWWTQVLWSPELGHRLDEERCAALNHFRAICIADGEWAPTTPWDVADEGPP